VFARALGLLGALVLALGPGPARADDPAWKIPDLATAGAGPQGDLIRRGAALIEETYAHLGPEIPNEAMRYAGNNLACKNCHLLNGTKKFGLPLAGASGPLPDKVNSCLVANLNGRPLPVDGPEMAAITAYITFLGSAMTPEQIAAGRGQRAEVQAGDPAAGRKLFAELCMICHSRNGLGKRSGQIGDGLGYIVPPLWGKDSFTGTSQFTSFQVLANFIHDNMPDGSTWDSPTLTPEAAANAAAFLLTTPRHNKQ